MNMVATDNSRTFATDADLVLDAAGGDAGAFESLFRRHVQSAWRLAQAVAATRDDAAKATSDAFARLLRDARRGRDAGSDQFRTQLLAAVYRNATIGPQASEERDPRPGGTGAGSRAGGGALGATVPLTSELRLVRGYRSLPARWRAALWLLEVEGFDAATAGAVLGVSSAAAIQLGKRGWSGLEQRVIQGGGEMPLPEPAPVLAASVAPFPTVLAARTEAKWRRSVSADNRWSAPLAGWVVERTSAPLKACAVGLCAMGIIAAALVGQGGGIAPTSPAGRVAAPRTAVPSLGANIDLGGAPRIPAAVTPTTVDTGTGGTVGTGAGTTPVAVPAATPALVSTAATPETPTTVVTAAATTTTLAPTPTTVSVTTIPTVSTTTLPPPVGPPPVLAARPVIQADINTGPVAVSLGLGQASCTGVNLLNLQIGCTTPTTGLSLTMLGVPLVP